MSKADLIRQSNEMIDFYRRLMNEYYDRANGFYGRAVTAEAELEAVRAKLREVTDERDRVRRELDFIAELEQIIHDLRIENSGQAAEIERLKKEVCK